MFNKTETEVVTESGDPESSVSTLQFASFSTRFSALAMDLVILIMILVIYSIAITTHIVPTLNSVENYILLFLLWALYSFLMEPGVSLGKMWKGIKVVDTKGEVLSKQKVFIRFLLRFLSFLTFGIGFFMQPFTARKQSLHDLLCGTVVIVTNVRKHNAKSVGSVSKGLLLLALCFVAISIIAIHAIEDYKKKVHFSRLHEVIDPIRYQEEKWVREKKSMLNLNFPNNWNGLGLAEKPKLPDEIDGIYLNEAGVIMLQVAPWVAGHACQVINTPSVINFSIEWRVATNCPPEYTRVDEGLADSEAEKVSRLIHSDANQK